MTKWIRRVSSRVRGVTALMAAVPFMFLGAACGAPAACVGGIGVCAAVPLPSSYVIIDPSGSQANQVGQEVAGVRALASHVPTELTVVLLGERPSTSKIVTRVSLPRIDASDPNAVATRTALLGKLDTVVEQALATSTTASDQWGALQLVHDDAIQRGAKPGYTVVVLGDSEPCVPGVCWTRAVPTPDDAVTEVKSAYTNLLYTGENVTFEVGGDADAARKSPSYVSDLSAADLAVCKWAQASACNTTTEIAEAN